MGKKDKKTLEYFEDNEHFAELVNGVLFEGKMILQPKNLHSTKRELINSENTKGQESYRDSVKKYSDETMINLFVVEHQQNIDYHMVVRNMLSEAMEYHYQWQQLKKERRKKKDLSDGHEYISGMSKKDRFMPVITLVVYYGKNKWDAAVSLHEILDFGNHDELLKKYVENYHIHVFDYHDYEEFDMFNGELKQVFAFLKYSNSKTNLRKYIAEHEDEYYNISRESCELISVLTDSKELMELEHYDDGIGGVNMCQALLEIKEEGREEGREEGICALICDYMEEGFSKEKILSKLQNRFLVSEEKAEYYFEKYSAKQ